jgi:CubicO group peptidase (beta-lactamase class C family)
MDQQAARHVRFILVALASFVATGIYARQSILANQPASASTPSIAEALSAAVTRGDIPGVVAIAADGQRVLYQGAFGVADAGSGRPLTPDAIVRIASMTKAVTSVAAMQLVEQGRLALDDPAEKYLPELANLKVIETFDEGTKAYTLRPSSKPPTVRQLLTHTSGLGYNFTSPIVRDFRPRPGEQYAAGPLLFDPGEDWLYGTSVDWIGRLVESISGETLETYFRDHIFRPLGMVDTFYNLPNGREGRATVVHRRRPDGVFEVGPNQPPSSVPRFNGGGGLASTAADYARFLQMFLNQGSVNGVRVLSASTVISMGQNHIGSVGVPAQRTALPQTSSDFAFIADRRDKWGLGFLITVDQQPGKRSAGSLSWGGLYNTYFWIDPARGVAGVILMQYLPFSDAKALAVYDAFERAVYRLPAVASN